MPFAIDRRQIARLAGPPVLAGIVLGANQARAGAYLSWVLSISYWLVIALVTWWTLAAATVVVRRILVPWRPPSWVIWLGGGITGSFVARPLIYAVAEAFRPLMHAPALRAMPSAEVSVAFLSYYVTNWTVILVMWVVSCWVATAWPSTPSAQATVTLAAPPPESQPEARTAGIVRRLPPELGRDILALQSEDHYVRVFTTKGDTLVLASISDAIEDVELSGIAGQRVHRSWWVANQAVAGSNAAGRRNTLCLVNGLEVPVSQTYRELARRTGVLPPTGAT